MNASHQKQTKKKKKKTTFCKQGEWELKKTGIGGEEKGTKLPLYPKKRLQANKKRKKGDKGSRDAGGARQRSVRANEKGKKSAFESGNCM